MENTTQRKEDRVAVWVHMGEHFLDTETRPYIATTAMKCLEAGFSVEEAKCIWQYEVAPILGPNLWSVAGEWIGWPTDWLVESIEKHRASRWKAPWPISYLFYRLGVSFTHGDWVSISRRMETLQTIESQDEREQVANDMIHLAEIILDFGPFERDVPNAAVHERALKLYPEPFKRCYAPALLKTELLCARLRLNAYEKSLTKQGDSRA